MALYSSAGYCDITRTSGARFMTLVYQKVVTGNQWHSEALSSIVP